MTSKEAVKLAYTEFQKDFDEGETTNQWLTNVIKGLKEAEKDLEVLSILKEYFQYTEFSGEWYIEMQESDFDFRSECSKEEWENSPQKKIKDWLRR